jgi:hypothetical protein
LEHLDDETQALGDLLVYLAYIAGLLVFVCCKRKYAQHRCKQETVPDLNPQPQ